MESNDKAITMMNETKNNNCDNNKDDDDDDFAFTPPLTCCEKIILNERLAIMDDKFINSTNNDNNQEQKDFNHWIYCIAVVNFDIEIGQSIECIYPKDAHLTEKEISNICYLSFPDSNSGCMGDTQFHFRTKCCPLIDNDKRLKYENFFKEFNTKCLSLLQIDQTYLNGFVYFRQVKDNNLKRGYFQKSLVLLTWLPFITLFQRIMKILSPKYFELGLPSLEAACADINRWPKPIPDQLLNLPLFGLITQVTIPGERHSSSMCQTIMSSSDNNNGHHIKSSPSLNYHQSLISKTLSLSKLSKKSRHNRHNVDHPQSSSSSSNIIELPSPLNVANDVNIYRNLWPIITHVQLLWELVLTNEPIAVITQTPNVCSQIVNALVALIAPLRYGADYRPFFTIHDSEFKEYTAANTKSPPPVILGVTNPFFVKTLQDWPHLIKINEFTNDKDEQNESNNNHQNQKQQSIKKLSNTLDHVLKLNLKSLELKTGVYTKYKPYLQKDRDILKKLLKGIDTNRPTEVQNAIIRRFLIELTQSFTIPLERYFASLMPLAKNLSPFKRPPILQHFKIDDFLNSLNATGPHLTSFIKGDWNGLYRRFLRSPNFVCWYSNRLDEATKKIQLLHLEKICDSNLVNQLNDKHEIEIVDLILKLKENLTITNGNNQDGKQNQNHHISSETKEKLKKNLDKIIDKLPEDSRLLFI